MGMKRALELTDRIDATLATLVFLTNELEKEVESIVNGSEEPNELIEVIHDGEDG
jgi:hypothetical protein